MAHHAYEWVKVKWKMDSSSIFSFFSLLLQYFPLTECPSLGLNGVGYRLSFLGFCSFLITPFLQFPVCLHVFTHGCAHSNRKICLLWKESEHHICQCEIIGITFVDDFHMLVIWILVEPMCAISQFPHMLSKALI